MRRIVIAGLLAVLIGLSACERGVVYDHYEHTVLAGWEKIDTLSYAVPRVTDNGLYAVTLGLRVNRLYPFQSLTLIVEQTAYPSRKTHVDTLNCQLVDANGNIKGNGVTHYQYNFHVSDLRLGANDSLHISVRHDMKREILPGISDVGIKVEKIRTLTGSQMTSGSR